MRERPKIDLGLTGYDEMFMNDQERAENRLPKIYDIPLNEIDDFPDHPFKVRLDEDMDQLVESVKSRGVITPVTLRQKEDGRYEIVSGHRRRKACELAGLETVPAEIKKLTRDEAIILMVESNLQRSVILPSEKAFSYKIQFDTLSSLGQYEVVAVFKFNTNKEDFRYNECCTMNEKAFKDFMSQVNARQLYDTGVDAEYGDQLLTLSTCEYTYNNGRLVVVAKKVN